MNIQRERDAGQSDLFKARLDQIVDRDHPLAKLARAIDWDVVADQLGAVYSDGPGHPPLPTRLMAGLAILKHMHDLSDEVLCARWLENPYYQLFCGEAFFCHALAFDRSSMTRWRQRMGSERLVTLLQESLAVATRSGAAKPADFTKVIVDTTVQPKAVAHPTDARLMHRARERLVRLAKKVGLDLRQSYARVGKRALIKHQRYAHAKQFKRARAALRTLRTQLGRVMRDIARKTKGEADLETIFARELMLAGRVHAQKKNLRRVRGQPAGADLRVFSLHAPEGECIPGSSPRTKGKAHKPYEFGVKATIATTLHRSAGGQFVIHAKALPGKPYDGHTLASVLPEIERWTGAALARVLTDAGYKGHNATPEHRFKVYTPGQKTSRDEGGPPPDAQTRRRRAGDRPPQGGAPYGPQPPRQPRRRCAAVILAAIGYNFRRLLARLAFLWAIPAIPCANQREATRPCQGV